MSQWYSGEFSCTNQPQDVSEDLGRGLLLLQTSASFVPFADVEARLCRLSSNNLRTALFVFVRFIHLTQTLVPLFILFISSQELKPHRLHPHCADAVDEDSFGYVVGISRKPENKSTSQPRMCRFEDGHRWCSRSFKKRLAEPRAIGFLESSGRRGGPDLPKS